MLLPGNEEQLASAPARLNGPVATLTSFDLHSPKEWRELGYSVLIDPVTGQTAAFTALCEAYKLQREGMPSGRKASETFAIYESFQDLAGFEELYEIERRTTGPGSNLVRQLSLVIVAPRRRRRSSAGGLAGPCIGGVGAIVTRRRVGLVVAGVRMTMPRSCLTSSGMVTGISSRRAVVPSEGALTGGDGKEGIGERADRGPAVP